MNPPNPMRCGSSKSPRKGKAATPYNDLLDWTRHLPTEWAEVIDAPLYFERYREYEINAERSVGFDADDRRCFTAHRFVLTRLVTDDDEEFYEEITLAEEMSAWRMHDERWLVFRRTTSSNCSQPRSFYSFSQTMPR